MTPRQRNVLDYIESYWEKHDYGPSYRDIAGWAKTSPSAIFSIVNILGKKGVLYVQHGKARAIYPVEVHKKLFITPDTDAERMRDALVEIRDVAKLSVGTTLDAVVEFYTMLAEKGLGEDRCVDEID